MCGRPYEGEEQVSLPARGGLDMAGPHSCLAQPDCLLIAYQCTRTHSPHSCLAQPDCLLIAYQCTCTHPSHPLVSSPDCLLIAHQCSRTHSPHRCSMSKQSGVVCWTLGHGHHPGANPAILRHRGPLTAGRAPLTVCS